MDIPWIIWQYLYNLESKKELFDYTYVATLPGILASSFSHVLGADHHISCAQGRQQGLAGPVAMFPVPKHITDHEVAGCAQPYH
jgi:hypothetical protein